ncbi:glycosidase [Sphingobium sp. SA2]|uniref:glycosidase n=1 Tax=Sphingobium sp. SA2 TaxID=1524832 RepID=UPI0028C1DD98|nr:glycosidase [Sphingobium sp. SA2]MDT7533008.1 glycosidase [Sphingobium sp. SA2]
MPDNPASESSFHCRLWPGGSPQLRPASAASLTIGDHTREPPPGRSPVRGGDAAHHPSSSAATRLMARDKVIPNPVILDFNVERLERVTLEGPPALTERAHMSPYVWAAEDGGYEILIRARPRRQAACTDTGVIWHGRSKDGVHFIMTDRPAIMPGPDPIDIGGCEDPTPVCMPDGSYVVYYTGVLDDLATGQLLYATGPAIDRLQKKGIALASSKSKGNTKEATVICAPSGRWRMFYEYAEDDHSVIGLACGPDAAGPWKEGPEPFRPREDSWDNWHLSTGPMLTDDPDMPVMFYNGATRDARWRIGWVAFDRDCSHVVCRGIQPLLTPPPVEDRSATDIAFASSVIVEDGRIWLYYSLKDAELARAELRRS